jgi:hypothetical protein
MSRAIIARTKMPKNTYFHHGQYGNSVRSESDSDEFM